MRVVLNCNLMFVSVINEHIYLDYEFFYNPTEKISNVSDVNSCLLFITSSDISFADIANKLSDVPLAIEAL